MKLGKTITSIILAGSIGFAAQSFEFKSPIDKFVTTQKKELQTFNIEVTEKSKNDNFTKINREYILTIKDISPIIQTIKPNIKKEDLDTLKVLFNNMKLLVKMDFLKTHKYHKNAIKISLYSLNDDAIEILQQDPIGIQLLKYFKNKTLILADINNFEIVKTKLLDLNLDLINRNSNNTEEMKLNTKNIFMTNTNLKMDNFLFDYSKIYDNNQKTEIKYNLKELNYYTNEKNNLNLKTNLTIKNISIKTKSLYNNFTISFNGIKSKSNINTLFNNTNISNKFSINYIEMMGESGYIKANNLTLNTMISNLDSNSLKNTIKSIKNKNKLAAKTYAIQLLNKGFEIKISPLSIKNIDININNKRLLIDPISINLDLTFPINNFNQYSNPQVLLNIVDTKLHLETTQKNISLLSQLNQNLFILLSSVMKIANNKVIIDMEYKNSHIYSNNRQIN